jgi:hypothetical protein
VAVQVSGSQVLIRLKQDFKFFRDKLLEDANAHFMSQILASVMGQPYQIGFAEWGGVSDTAQPASEGSPVVAAQAESRSQAASLSTPQKINHIVALFEGKIT